jgi:hypothetical protein
MTTEYEQRACAIRAKRIEDHLSAIKAWNPENDDITELAVTLEVVYRDITTSCSSIWYIQSICYVRGSRCDYPSSEVSFRIQRTCRQNY